MHTIVVSDLHLTEAQPRLPDKPLWKRYKQRDLFIDACFDRFLRRMTAELPAGSELILNGDTFDFDAVMAVPRFAPYKVSWLERHRGLEAEEPKSRFKMEVILREHPVFVQALRRWITAGNQVVLVIGNHDIELHWASVQHELLDALDLPPDHRDALRVCEWFYLSHHDTLVEHGNQFDPYCLCSDPIHPTVRWAGRERIRVPFGNVAERYMLNAMGLFNPHVENSFIKPLGEYIRFFFRYMLRVQPLLVFTWLGGALATLVISLREGLLPAVRNPLGLERRVAEIARRANATPQVVWALRALHVHPAVFTPWKIMRELWLDRALILALIIYASFQVITVLNVFQPISPWWAAVIFLLLLPPFAFYARSVNSDVDQVEHLLRDRLPTALRVARVRRAVIGHTHREQHLLQVDLELINTGTWSPAYEDVECSIPYGRKCFAWIRPGKDGRVAGLFEWKDPGFEQIPPLGPSDRLAKTMSGYRSDAASKMGANMRHGPHHDAQKSMKTMSFPVTTSSKLSLVS